MKTEAGFDGHALGNHDISQTGLDKAPDSQKTRLLTAASRAEQSAVPFRGHQHYKRIRVLSPEQVSAGSRKGRWKRMFIMNPESEPAQHHMLGRQGRDSGKLIFTNFH
jgi:hypothetical protein